MPTKSEIREQYGDSLGPEGILKSIADKLNPAGIDEVKSRGWKWKLDLWRRDKDEKGNQIWVNNKKNKFDLYQELAKAPSDISYDPGPTQMAAHKSESKTKQVSGGWRGGKSAWLAAEIFPYLFRDNAHVWIVATDYLKARYEFEYIVNWSKWLDIPITRLSLPGNGRWLLEFEWGARLETQTADDPTQIEGAALDCAAVAEAGLMDQAIVRRLRGRVSQKRGPILMSGSLDDSQPWYMETFEEFINGPTEEMDWHAWGIPSWDNKYVYPEGRNDPAILEYKATLSEDEFKLKICAQVAKPSELVFPEFDKSTHLVDMSFEWEDTRGYTLDYPEAITDDIGVRTIAWRLPRRGETILAIDPGFNGAYAVLACRKYDDRVFVFDEVYVRRWVADDVIKECKTRDWWTSVSYAVMDIAGKQHDAMSSHVEIWAQDTALGFSPATNYVPVPDGIQKLKVWLKNPLNGRPRVWFSRKCKHTADEFGKYRYRMAKEGRPEREEPVDRDNHAIKALEYLLVDRYGMSDTSKRVRSESYIKGSHDTNAYIQSGANRRWWFDS